MRCKFCGELLARDAMICVSCGKSVNFEGKLTHWASIVCTAVAFFLFYGILGGDPFYEEVNLFDYIAVAFGIIAIALAIIFIPKARAMLRVMSIVLASISTLSAVAWIVLYGL